MNWIKKVGDESVQAGRLFNSKAKDTDGSPLREDGTKVKLPAPLRQEGRIKHAILRNEPILFSRTFCCIDLIYKDVCSLQRRLQMGSFSKNEPKIDADGKVSIALRAASFFGLFRHSSGSTVKLTSNSLPGEMSEQNKLRLTVFEVALFLVVLAIGWAALRAFRFARQVDQIPVTFREMPEAYFRVADYLEPSVGELNDILLRYTTRHDRADLDRFQRKSQELRDWLTEMKGSSLKTKITMLQPVQITTDMGTLLEEIGTTYEAYLTEAHRAARESATDDSVQSAARLDKVRLQSRKLVAIASRARAQGQAIEIFLSGSKLWLLWLQRLLLAALLLLVAFGFWVMLIAYRRVVSPLRRRLTERDTIIERSQKMAHFGELAAGVAHEIRNPLTAIRARLFTLQKTLAAGTPAHEDALVIRNEIERLNRIVTDFLQLARPAEPRLVPVTGEALLHEVRDLFAPQCERQNIELKIDPVNGARFLADPQQMKQVLINLIQNAADSIDVDGVITLRARHDTRRLHERTAEVVVLEVADTGAGIPPDIEKRLFDPFFSTKKGGTGLGLSIAAQIVVNHHGKLEFQTEAGRGTTFAIVLPATPEAP